MKQIIFGVSLIILLLVPTLASAVRFDVQKAMQEEWGRYEQYKKEYVEFNHLEAYADQIDERQLMANFGFYGPAHYAISPEVLAAKYNPPLQGEAYCTTARGCSASLEQPSAVKYYADRTNGRYSGFIPSNANGIYFDHPQANGNGAIVGTVTGPSFPIGYADAGYASYAGYDYGNYGTQNYRYYARVAEPLGNGFYTVGFY